MAQLSPICPLDHDVTEYFSASEVVVRFRRYFLIDLSLTLLICVPFVLAIFGLSNLHGPAEWVPHLGVLCLLVMEARQTKRFYEVVQQRGADADTMLAELGGVWRMNTLFMCAYIPAKICILIMDARTKPHVAQIAVHILMTFVVCGSKVVKRNYISNTSEKLTALKENENFSHEGVTSDQEESAAEQADISAFCPTKVVHVLLAVIIVGAFIFVVWGLNQHPTVQLTTITTTVPGVWPTMTEQKAPLRGLMFNECVDCKTDGYKTSCKNKATSAGVAGGIVCAVISLIWHAACGGGIFKVNKAAGATVGALGCVHVFILICCLNVAGSAGLTVATQDICYDDVAFQGFLAGFAAAVAAGPLLAGWIL